MPYAFRSIAILDYDIKKNSVFVQIYFSIMILAWTVPNEGVSSKSTLRFAFITFHF